MKRLTLELQKFNNMKVYLFFSLLTIATSSCTQTIQHIDNTRFIEYEYKKIDSLTSLSHFGNLFPLSYRESLLNLGYMKLCIINNTTGKVIKEFDENLIRTEFNTILKNNYNGLYAIPKTDEYDDIPSCQKFPFRYERFFKIDSEKKYPCLISCWVEKVTDPNQVMLIRGVAFFNEKLEVIDFYEINEDIDTPSSHISGGFFYDENTFFTRKDNPVAESFDFFLFMRKNENFEKIGEVTKWPKSTKQIYYPGRFFSMFELASKYYINNGTNLICFETISSSGNVIDLPIDNNECVIILEPVNNQSVIGLILEKLDGEGTSGSARLSLFDATFNQEKPVKEYNLLNYTVNSMKVLDDILYLFLFDKKKQRYILETISLYYELEGAER